MIIHYLKIAVRNLMRYKTQSIISILGLAAGFVCFALSLIWIEYESTYDTQHKEADRMYILYSPNSLNVRGCEINFSNVFRQRLQEMYPEIESSNIQAVWEGDNLKVNEKKVGELRSLQADSTFIDRFGLELKEGSFDFLHVNDKAALTEEGALRLFGTVDVLGQTFQDVQGSTYTVGAVFKSLSHSFFSFDVWYDCARFERVKKMENVGVGSIVLTLRKGVDPMAFQKKMQGYDGEDVLMKKSLQEMKLMPLSEFHHSMMNEKNPVQFYYLVLFAAVGLLIILAALFNYLSIFVIRLGIRQREIALRKVCGATWGKLFSMFIIEYSVMTMMAMCLSLLLIEWSLPAFTELSGVSGSVTSPLLLYWTAIWILTVVLLIFLVRHYARPNRTIHESRIRKIAVFFQLTVSILMMFCMVVLMKQIFLLQKGDMGWKRSGIATLDVYPAGQLDEIIHRLSGMASVDTIIPYTVALAPSVVRMSYTPSSWEGKVDSVSSPGIRVIQKGHVLIPFYEITLKEGTIPVEGDRQSVVLNEAAVKALGMSNPVGKTIDRFVGEKRVKISGIVKDPYINPPTLPATPLAFVSWSDSEVFQMIIRFKEGQWKTFKQQVEEMFAKDYPEVHSVFTSTEEYYDKFLYSEHLLIKLLSVVSLVCVAIAAFGIYSMITLSCERRRKEIAIRKVNGAKVRDIQRIFIREYVWLLVWASLIAFPVGYILMKQWLVSYIRQTEIAVWIYAVIFSGVALLIALCIGWRVWKTSRINPAEVIKSE